MTKREIELMAKELSEAILEALKKNPDLTYNEILHDFLSEFNDEIRNQLLEKINKYEKSAIALGASALPFTKSKLELSPRLYKNAEYVAKQASRLVDEFNATKSTLGDLATALYDGYGYGEVLDIKKDLPGFLQKQITEEKVARLKTKSLKAAYLDVLDAKTDAEYAKAMKVLVEEKSRYYALRIAQTEQQRAYSIAQAAKFAADGVKLVKWTLSPSHQIPCICDLYATKNSGWGDGVYPLRAAPMPVYSSHPFCLTGDSLISSRYPINKIFRRHYEGLIYTIKTKSGNSIKCTPNHPILTPEGFVSAESLKVGGKVISDGDSKWKTVGSVENQDGIARIDKLFESLVVSGSMPTIKMPVSAEDFHGDGIPKSEVDIIDIHGGLRLEGNSTSSHTVKEHSLDTGVNNSILFNSFSSFKFFLSALRFTSNSVVRFFGVCHSLLFGKPAVSNDILFGGASLGDSSIVKPPVDDSPTYSKLNSDIKNGTLGDDIFIDNIVDVQLNSPIRSNSSILKPSVDNISTYSKLSSDILSRSLGDNIFIDDIIDIQSYFTTTHVYNLENEMGYYTANGVINHNCRCKLVPVNAEDLKFRPMTEPQKFPPEVLKRSKYSDYYPVGDFI